MRMAMMENVEYSKGLKELEVVMGKNGGLEKINMIGDVFDVVLIGNGMLSGKGVNYRWS